MAPANGQKLDGSADCSADFLRALVCFFLFAISITYYTTCQTVICQKDVVTLLLLVRPVGAPGLDLGHFGRLEQHFLGYQKVDLSEG